MPSAHGRSPIRFFWITTAHLPIDGLNFAKENGIIMLSFQAHCSHRLQPLNRGVYGRLKSMQMLSLISGRGTIRVKKKKLTIYDSLGIVAIAYPIAAKPTECSSRLAGDRGSNLQHGYILGDKFCTISYHRKFLSGPGPTRPKY